MSQSNIKGTTRNDKTQNESHSNCIELVYCESELDFSKINWPVDGISFAKSQFDRILTEEWDSALQNGCFWYTLDEVKRRRVEGKIGFIAQLNTKRFNSRRKPSDIQSVQEPFLDKRFNFTKVKENEVLFKIVSDHDRKYGNDRENLMIINVSPIDYAHVLFVPDAKGCHPQRLNYDALKMAIEICLLSTHRGLRIGFNSLCAFASVNHLHFHVLYINHVLPIDKVDVSPIGHGLFELKDYFVRGFALELENHDIHQLARRCDEITSLLYEDDIAHNLLIYRGVPFNSRGNTQESSIRVFIFPKLPAPGVKDTKYLNSCCFDLGGYLLLKAMSDYPFNAASLEISGYLPIRDEKEFEDLSENQAISILNRFCLRDDEFDDLKNKISLVLQNLNL